MPTAPQADPLDTAIDAVARFGSSATRFNPLAELATSAVEALIENDAKKLKTRTPEEAQQAIDAGRTLDQIQSVGLLGKTAARRDLRKMAGNLELSPVTIAAELDADTNKEWRDWLPETLCSFCGVPDDDVLSRDRLMATQVACTNPDVFGDWMLFAAVNAPFNQRRASFEFLDVPTYLEAAWTCTVLRALQPKMTFSAGLCRFLVAIMLHDGLVVFPWTGGTGLSLGGPADAGLHDCEPLAAQVRGYLPQLTDVEPSEHDASDPLHVQLAKIVSGNAYITAQQKAKDI